MLTEEKAKALAEYLAKDEARTKKLTELDGASAAETMRADGLDITAEELAEFAEGMEEITKTQKSGELDEAALEGVSGGSVKLSRWWGYIKPIVTLPYYPVIWRR